MNRPLLTDFLKQYPNCPTCNGTIHESRKQIKTKGRSGPHHPIPVSNFEYVEYRCLQGHFNIGINIVPKVGAPLDDVYVHVLHFCTADYDVSIYIPDDWIRIFYGFANEVERTFKCVDYNKWMLSHEQMIDKLEKLWSLA